MTKTSNIFAAAVAASAIGFAAQAQETVRIATDATYAPWAYMENGEMTGMDIEFIEEICTRMEVTCEVQNQGFDGIIPGLLAGRYDAIIASLGANEERRKTMAFSDPYSIGRNFFFGGPAVAEALSEFEGQEVDLSALGADDQGIIDAMNGKLDGLTAGVQSGTNNLTVVETYFSDALSSRAYQSGDAAALDLLADRVEIVFDGESAFDTLKERDDFADYSVVGPAFVGGPLGDGVSVGLRLEDAELKAKFDAAIADMLADGYLSELSVKWLGKDTAPVAN